MEWLKYLSNQTVHNDTWVYKKSKHEFWILASKPALWCKNRSSLNKNYHRWWKFMHIEACFTNLTLHLWWLYYRKPSFSIYLLSLRSMPSPYVPKFLGPGSKKMAVFEIFLLFMYHCVVKSSVCSVVCIIRQSFFYK